MYELTSDGYAAVGVLDPLAEWERARDTEAAAR